MRHIQNHVFAMKAPVMSLVWFMAAFRLYCKLYDYMQHATFINLSVIEDLLILASHRNRPPMNWRERCRRARPKGANPDRPGDLDAALWSLNDLSRSVRFALQLYVHVFHLRNGYAEMTDWTLTRARVAYDKRSLRLLNGLLPEPTLATSH